MRARERAQTRVCNHASVPQGGSTGRTLKTHSTQAVVIVSVRECACTLYRACA